MSYASLNLDTEIYWCNHVVYILARYFKFVIDLRCRFVRDVRVAMFAVCWWSRTKHLSPLGTKIKFSCKFFEKKFYCIEQQHTTDMASLSRGCNPRIHFAQNRKLSIRAHHTWFHRQKPENCQKKKKQKTKIHWRLLIKHKYAQDLFISYSSSSFFFFKRVTFSLQ